jgi:UDP-N-acetylglucosamine--N-acetylmuramyl-(pentapeptide) pyrophosphoryl-undecaprenol N-acetylglucosamine transferase
VVGRPIPERARPISQAGAREIFELPADQPVLLVAGALAGARSINELVVESFAEVGPAILHISGERDYESLRRRVKRTDYRLIASTDRIGAAYSAADLVLSRAGSGVWEVAAAGKPAILVPYPFATADHQARNAEFFVRAGGAVMVRELDLEDVPDLVRSMLGDPERLARMGEAMRRVAKPSAAEEIAEGLIELASS